VSDSTSCSVCGRTILKGEGTRTYMTPEAEARNVCDLCRGRAEALHWVWAEVADQQRADPSLRRRRGSLVGWFREHGRGRRRAQPAQEADSKAPAAETSGPHGNGSERRQDIQAANGPDPAARGAGVGRAAAREPGTRLERAVARFNESPHAHMVAGLTKTLGPPSVSVGVAAGSPTEVRVTVAWELSWYQWGVDLGEPSMGVYEINKGHELSEIDAPARQWNAHAAEDGNLRLGTVPAPQQGQPAGTEG
jgi:hypothetical protein